MKAEFDVTKLLFTVNNLGLKGLGGSVYDVGQVPKLVKGIIGDARSERVALSRRGTFVIEQLISLRRLDANEVAHKDGSHDCRGCDQDARTWFSWHPSRLSTTSTCVSDISRTRHREYHGVR